MNTISAAHAINALLEAARRSTITKKREKK